MELPEYATAAQPMAAFHHFNTKASTATRSRPCR